MSKINEIMDKYTAGEITVEEANAKLKKEGCIFHLDPGRHELTEEEKRATTVGYYPEQANGFGLLDTGTGTMDKVEVRDGRLVGCDVGDMYALFLIAGKRYQVQGDRLVD